MFKQLNKNKWTLLMLLISVLITSSMSSVRGENSNNAVIIVVWVDDIHSSRISINEIYLNFSSMKAVKLSYVGNLFDIHENYYKYLNLADVLLIVNPIKNYSDSELNQILKWVNEGGIVIIVFNNYTKILLNILHKFNINITKINDNCIFFAGIKLVPSIKPKEYDTGYINYGKGKVVVFKSIKLFLKYSRKVFQWLSKFIKEEEYISTIKIKLLDIVGKPIPDVIVRVNNALFKTNNHGELIVHFKGNLCSISCFCAAGSAIYFRWLNFFIKPRLGQVCLMVKISVLPRVEITVWSRNKPKVLVSDGIVKVSKINEAYRISIIFNEKALCKIANISIIVDNKKYILNPILNRNVIFYSIGDYPGEKIYVKVVDEDQRPVDGAVVYVHKWELFRPLVRIYVFSITNASGIAWVPKEEGYIIAFKDFKNTTYVDLLGVTSFEHGKTQYKLIILKRIGFFYSFKYYDLVNTKSLKKIELICHVGYPTGKYYVRVGDFILTNYSKGYTIKMGRILVFDDKYEFYKHIIYIEQHEIVKYRELLNKGLIEGIILSDINATLDECNYLINDALKSLLFRDYEETSLKCNIVLNYLDHVKYTLALYVESLPLTSILLIFINAIFCLITASFIVSENKWKLRIIVSASCFAAIILLLHLCHPGFRAYIIPGIPYLLSFIIMLGLILIISFILFRESSRLEGRLAILAFEVSLRNIRRRRLRSALFLFTVAAMVFSLVLFSSISVAVFNFRSLVGFDTNAVSSGIVLHLRYLKDYEKIAVFKAAELVARNYTVVYRVMSLKPGAYCHIDRVGDREGYLSLLCRNEYCVKVRGVLGIVPSLEEKLTILPKIVVRGRFLRDNDTYGVLVSLAYAEKLGLKVGDVIRFKGFKLRIVGIFDERLYAQVKDLDGMFLRPWNKFSHGIITVDSRATSPEGVVIVHEDFAKKLDICYIDKVIIVTSSADDALKVASQLLPLLPPRVVPFICLGSEAYLISRSHFFSIKGAETLVLLAIGSLIIVNLMLAEVYDRSREIEIYTAVGMNPLQVALIFFTQSIILAFSGGGLGYVASALTVLILKTVYSSYSVNIIPLWSVTVLATVITVCLASTIIPAHRASLKVVPSFMRKWKLKFKKGVYEETLPFKIPLSKANIIISSICNKIKSKYSYYGLTRIEEEKISEEKTTDSVVKKISYKISFTSGVLFAQVVQVDFIFERKLDKDYYTLKLKVKPITKTYKYKEELYSLIDNIRKTCLEICSGSLK